MLLLMSLLLLRCQQIATELTKTGYERRGEGRLLTWKRVKDRLVTVLSKRSNGKEKDQKGTREEERVRKRDVVKIENPCC